MAGIEKICEYSGEYCGPAMYSYKHNQLQIMPQYRKLFRGDGDTIYVQNPKKYFVTKWGGYSSFNELEMLRCYDPPFTNESEFIKYKKEVRKERLCYCYDFAYVVNNYNLKGNVRGVYYNHTYDLKTTKRKMKRLLRCKKLNVVFVDNLYEYMKKFKNC